MPEFYIRPMFDRKIFFRDFFCVCVGGGAGQRPSPVSYAYGWAPGPHQLNPALISSPKEQKESGYPCTLTVFEKSSNAACTVRSILLGLTDLATQYSFEKNPTWLG